MSEHARPAEQVQVLVVDDDAVLLGCMMPGRDGMRLLERFRALPGHTAVLVIMITADKQSPLRHQAREPSASGERAGPAAKPPAKAGLKARLQAKVQARGQNRLAPRAAQQNQARRADSLHAGVREAAGRLAAREAEGVRQLVRAAGYRDPETGAHLERMAGYARLIAAGLGWSSQQQALLLAAAPMHDIGKVGIPDQILLKPGLLDAGEMAIMRTHPLIGADILGQGLGDSPLLQMAAAIALAHHERYDGRGYPHGLHSEQIPQAARIVAVADVFDALTSPRPYKAAWTLERAHAFLLEHSGTHFDPACVAAFMDGWGEVLAIHQLHHD